MATDPNSVGMNAPHDRRDDWSHGVDENLASLNSGQRVLDHEIGQMRRLLSEIDNLLRGDPERDTDGLIARLHAFENDLNMLKAIILTDKAGNRGLVARVEMLESGEKRVEYRWKFWVALITLAGTLAVLAVKEWGSLRYLFEEKPAPSATKRTKLTKQRIKRVPLPPIEVPPDDDEPESN